MKVMKRSVRPARVTVKVANLVPESPSVTVMSSTEMVGSGSSFVMLRDATVGVPSRPVPVTLLRKRLANSSRSLTASSMMVTVTVLLV